MSDDEDDDKEGDPHQEVDDADKGRNCLYMKLCDLILLSMILQLE